MNARSPIGIFDSGIGGLTVANAVSRHLPQEEIIYIGDTAHFPYGDKSVEAIQQYALRLSEVLLQKHCKMILIACNTASAAAFPLLQQELKDRGVLLVNVIDPVVDSVCSEPAMKKVGIIATKGTISSGVYEQKIKAKNPKLEVASLATQLLAPMIESGFYNNSVSQAIINSYLTYPDFQDIDGMILACTHYPLVRREIDYFFKGRIRIFDSTDVTARYVAGLLERHHLLRSGETPHHHFYVTDLTESFAQTARLFYPGALTLEYLPVWETEPS